MFFGSFGFELSKRGYFPRECAIRIDTLQVFIDNLLWMSNPWPQLFDHSTKPSRKHLEQSFPSRLWRRLFQNHSEIPWYLLKNVMFEFNITFDSKTQTLGRTQHKFTEKLEQHKLRLHNTQRNLLKNCINRALCIVIKICSALHEHFTLGAFLLFVGSNFLH